MATKRTFFRVLYRSLYFLLYILLLALLVITPGDVIVRSFRNGQTYNVWILAICFVATILIVAFIYAIRLYVNKTVLASIPKTWVPTDKSDVGKAVYKVIQAGLDRSAAIAYVARPRPQHTDGETQQDQAPVTVRLAKTRTGTGDAGVNIIPNHKLWANIDHPGWASPNSPDLPNLQYNTVISELPHLIEAKALTLAPPDPTSQSQPPALDAEAFALLQRQPSLSLRGYLEHLMDLQVLESDAPVSEFITQYEHARFSRRPVSGARFKDLMHLFAEVLRSLKPLDLDALELADEVEESDDDDVFAPSISDIDDDAPAGTNPSTPGGTLSRSVTLSTQASVRRPPRTPSANTWQHYRTAPTTPRSRRADMVSRQSSGSSISQARRQALARQASNSTLRSRTSNDSGSIIRLATHDDLSDLPFVLSLRETTASY
ncbi:hypothetical protein HJFPF1_06663 [Paramyrothecium foliicola]|nr:hypothetical protein HJFPF1_06663 [Paramyrothecium foliicola]